MKLESLFSDPQHDINAEDSFAYSVYGVVYYVSNGLLLIYTLYALRLTLKGTRSVFAMKMLKLFIVFCISNFIQMLCFEPV